ncbi:sulfite exporter TauE/SafE family protein [Actinotalea subterranea]|uniref:urease accessory protein UreH domain-containing protein n=1 Tax=Actinotalea subterranea TaxID=2607497 RepID=UPI00165E2EB4|nr:sulfite exporter TauE/SafE family protein [Actinotalea subterranea]
MAVIDVPVKGMTCQACEVRISKALRTVPGVLRVKVSVRRGIARVHTDAHVPRGRLHKAIQRAGYEPGRDEPGWLTSDRTVWGDVLAAVVVLAGLGLVLQVSGLSDLAGQVGTLASSGSLAMVVVLGVAAGLSTCMALVGGLVLAVSARHAELHPQASTVQRLRPQLAFNFGRVVGFGVLGSLVGLLGSAFTLSGRALAVMMVVVSLVMASVGLKLTSLSPRLSRGGTLTLPPALMRLLRLDRADGPYSDGRAALLGAGTFLLPCGFTQAVQVYAMSTGSPLRAGLIMSLFALGTLPGLLGIGGLTAAVRGATATRFFRFAGVAVLAFAAINISGAAGILLPALIAPPTATTATGPTQDGLSTNVEIEGDIQVLKTRQVATGYEPATATVYLGREVRWEIDSVAVSCAASLYSADLGIEPMVLEPGLNVLTFTPTQTGTLRYSCGMGMYWGAITVIEEPTAAAP